MKTLISLALLFGFWCGTLLAEEANTNAPIKIQASEAKANIGPTVPVHLHAKVTEVGQLELSCIGRDKKHKWKLQFNVREQT